MSKENSGAPSKESPRVILPAMTAAELKAVNLVTPPASIVGEVDHNPAFQALALEQVKDRMVPLTMPQSQLHTIHKMNHIQKLQEHTAEYDQLKPQLEQNLLLGRTKNEGPFKQWDIDEQALKSMASFDEEICHFCGMRHVSPKAIEAGGEKVVDMISGIAPPFHLSDVTPPIKNQGPVIPPTSAAQVEDVRRPFVPQATTGIPREALMSPVVPTEENTMIKADPWGSSPYGHPNSLMCPNPQTTVIPATAATRQAVLVGSMNASHEGSPKGNELPFITSPKEIEQVTVTEEDTSSAKQDEFPLRRCHHKDKDDHPLLANFHPLRVRMAQRLQFDRLPVSPEKEITAASKSPQADTISLNSDESSEESLDGDLNSVISDSSTDDDWTVTDEGMSEDSFEIISSEDSGTENPTEFPNRRERTEFTKGSDSGMESEPCMSVSWNDHRTSPFVSSVSWLREWKRLKETTLLSVEKPLPQKPRLGRRMYQWIRNKMRIGPPGRLYWLRPYARGLVQRIMRILFYLNAVSSVLPTTSALPERINTKYTQRNNEQFSSPSTVKSSDPHVYTDLMIIVQYTLGSNISEAWTSRIAIETLQIASILGYTKPALSLTVQIYWGAVKAFLKKHPSYRRQESGKLLRARTTHVLRSLRHVPRHELRLHWRLKGNKSVPRTLAVSLLTHLTTVKTQTGKLMFSNPEEGLLYQELTVVEEDRLTEPVILICREFASQCLNAVNATVYQHVRQRATWQELSGLTGVNTTYADLSNLTITDLKRYRPFIEPEWITTHSESPYTSIFRIDLQPAASSWNAISNSLRTFGLKDIHDTVTHMTSAAVADLEGQNRALQRFTERERIDLPQVPLVPYLAQNQVKEWRFQIAKELIQEISTIQSVIQKISKDSDDVSPQILWEIRNLTDTMSYLVNGLNHVDHYVERDEKTTIMSIITKAGGLVSLSVMANLASTMLFPGNTLSKQKQPMKESVRALLKGIIHAIHLQEKLEMIVLQEHNSQLSLHKQLQGRQNSHSPLSRTKTSLLHTPKRDTPSVEGPVMLSDPERLSYKKKDRVRQYQQNETGSARTTRDETWSSPDDCQVNPHLSTSVKKLILRNFNHCNLTKIVRTIEEATQRLPYAFFQAWQTIGDPLPKGPEMFKNRRPEDPLPLFASEAHRMEMGLRVLLTLKGWSLDHLKVATLFPKLTWIKDPQLAQVQALARAVRLYKVNVQAIKKMTQAAGTTWTQLVYDNPSLSDITRVWTERQVGSRRTKRFLFLAFIIASIVTAATRTRRSAIQEMYLDQGNIVSPMLTEPQSKTMNRAREAYRTRINQEFMTYITYRLRLINEKTRLKRLKREGIKAHDRLDVPLLREIPCSETKTNPRGNLTCEKSSMILPALALLINAGLFAATAGFGASEPEEVNLQESEKKKLRAEVKRYHKRTLRSQRDPDRFRLEQGQVISRLFRILDRLETQKARGDIFLQYPEYDQYLHLKTPVRYAKEYDCTGVKMVQPDDLNLCQEMIKKGASTMEKGARFFTPRWGIDNRTDTHEQNEELSVKSHGIAAALAHLSQPLVLEELLSLKMRRTDKTVSENAGLKAIPKGSNPYKPIRELAPTIATSADGIIKEAVPLNPGTNTQRMAPLSMTIRSYPRTTGLPVSHTEFNRNEITHAPPTYTRSSEGLRVSQRDHNPYLISEACNLASCCGSFILIAIIQSTRFVVLLW